MSRPTDWSPLDLGSDPVPGDPDVVEGAGNHYVAVAEAIQTAATRLRQIADHEAMTSLAVSKVREKAEDVADDVERAHERYAGVGQALVRYATPLRTAQADADRALRNAETAQADLRAAEARESAARSDLETARTNEASAPPGGPPADHSGLEGAVSRAAGDAQDARNRIAAAKRLVESAETSRDAAAHTAAGAIDDVDDSGDLNDGWWDNHGAKIVKTIAEWAGNIAAIAGVAALLVGWIPVIGQALAAILGTLALLAALVSLLANFTLAMTGDGGWGAVLLDVVSLATFGIGRAVIKGSTAAYRGAQATARLNAGRMAATSSVSRAAGGSRAAIRGLTGGRPVGNLSRNQARTMLRQAQRVPGFSWGAPFRSAAADARAFGPNLRTVFTPSNMQAAVQQSPAALTSLRNSQSMTEFMARMTQNSDTLAHLDFTRAVNPAVQTGEMFTRATNLTVAHFGSTGVGAGVDAYQASQIPFGDATPAQTLNLDSGASFDVQRDR